MLAGAAIKESAVTITEVVKEQGWWNGKTAELSKRPQFLEDPAKGKFDSIEKALKKQGVEIPRNWKVLNMLAAIAVAGARMVNDRTNDNLKINFDEFPPKVTLILDQYFRKVVWNEVVDTGIRIKVEVGNQVFRGEINTAAGYDYAADHPQHTARIGLPSIGIELGNGKSYGSSPGRLLNDDFLPVNANNPHFTKLINLIGATIKSFQK